MRKYRTGDDEKSIVYYVTRGEKQRFRTSARADIHIYCMIYQGPLLLNLAKID